ncbi:hypothetical protein H310_15074 [Aphanomyces invadans]|uniref:HTH CENPB-type domain-containing protein n=1 Tax=Aphanomyces invadans TaxID=157072 RepID=A0A024T814_9STRA|nr:hypothetical protein H310_15074 [Aphanomyces invadans]ETV90093.1 hypothetical protein H310_15074 [Aphanomyces invadans]|eukprot:XP_008881274.1 hypothetical protein H310_15074 [Aphanomyces invadans]
MKSYNIANKAMHRRSNLKPPKFPELESKLATWVDAAYASNVCITRPNLNQKALRLAAQLGISQFSASQGWLFEFQWRHNFRVHRLHGESASVEPNVVKTGQESLLVDTGFYEA